MKHQEVKNHIINWLSNYANNSGMKGFVIGISGGIDSAITSTLCAHTGLPTLVISMPIHQQQNQLSRANNHIAWLKEHFENVESHTVNLSESFDTLKKSLPLSIQDDLSMANTRSRLRMSTLYAFATNRRFLVAGTGNKVEDFGVGFYTKYGDGGVDVSPIADLMKTEVFALAAHMGINQEILAAPPTDGLWDDDRTDEQQMGATYPELEWAMRYLEKSDLKFDGLNSREKEVIEIYQSFHRKNLHKMIPIPVCEIPKDFF